MRRSQEFKECVSTDLTSSKCKDLQEDYLECLHHKKEVRLSFLRRPRGGLVVGAAPLNGAHARARWQIARFNALNAERRKKVAAGEPVPKLVQEQIATGAVSYTHLTLPTTPYV